MQNLLEDLKNLLEKRAEYIEDGKLFKNKIVEDALKLEPSLIKLLLKNKTIKETFFVEADGFLVFDKIAFQDFVLNEEFLPSSYTKFKKQLGLASGDKLFCKNREVSLIWAYKDCILEGGQTKEETKREEIFYNETLSPDEINVLFAPKVLTKFERISAETAESLLPSTQQSDSADRAGRLNKKEQNRQRLAARFCDTLISKISAAKSASEIFEVCERPKMQGDRAAFKETKSGSVAQPLDSKSLLPFTARKGFLKKSEGGGGEASEGEADAAFFHRNEKGIITDNLLIKGNNLLALHTIKKEFSGQIKLIYIDPPYNTGNDGFKYNDSFNHSTWLTFMKNRLEIARELLRDDGVIFVQCDDNEQAYLKVLMDEIFGRENFVINLVWQNREGGGKSDSKFFRKKHEYILVYAKNSNSASINPIDVEDIDRYTLSDKYIKTRGKYQLIKLDSGSLGWVKSLDYPIELEGKIFYAGGNKEKWENRQKGGASIKDWGWRWRWSKEKLEWGLKNDFVEIKEGQRGVWNIYTKQYLNCDDDGNLTPRKIQPIGVIDKFSTTQSNRHMKELFGNAIFNYSKPEDYLKFVVDITCAENDIVLDFFVGSGTTAAVAHKMNRQYIGIEQMDYIETIAKERLKKVIDGEQGGISKSVSWQGGGSFIYLELLEWNERIIQSIQTAKQTSELLEIYRNAKTQEFMRYEIEDFNEADFGKLSLKEQKKILCDCLDKNHLYVNLSEIDDKKYEVSEKDKALNKEFYREHK